MRLIDVDELLKILREKEKKPQNTYYKVITYDYLINNIIDKLPTAYNIDKVVEELETMSQYITFKDMFAVHENVKMIATDTAIEIVKHGGVSDDVRECRKYRIIDDVQMYDSSYYHEFEERCVKKYKYCPYCGEKYKGGGVDE